MTELLVDIAMRTLLLLLWGGGGVAVLLGAGLLLAPAKTAALNNWLSRWIDTSGFDRAASRSRRMERLIYRHHRVAGVWLSAGSAWLLYKLLLNPAQWRAAASRLPDPYGLLDIVAAMLIVVAVLGMTIGAIVAAKPSLLRELEEAANAWISTDRIFRYLDSTHIELDTRILRYRKTSGVFLVVVGMFILHSLGRLL